MPDPSATESLRGHLAPNQAAADPTTSFREVYHEHFDFVWRFALNLGVPRAYLDDVTQDVFLAVSRRLHTFEGRSTLKSWIGGVARHVILDRLRKLATRAKHESPEAHAPAIEDPRNPGHSAELKAAAAVMRNILAGMSELQRETFILCEIEEFSAVEVAQLLNTNENTIRTRLRSARAAFQQALKQARAHSADRTDHER